MDYRLSKIINIVRSLNEEVAVAMPTNNVSSGNIAGTKAAGDDPPVRKKRPPVIARGLMPGSRKRWGLKRKKK